MVTATPHFSMSLHQNVELVIIYKFLFQPMEIGVLRVNIISKIVLDYFGSLFTSEHPTETLMQPVLDVVSPKVDDNMNQLLCAPFTAADIKRALFDMHPDKAPGPMVCPRCSIKNSGQ